MAGVLAAPLTEPRPLTAQQKQYFINRQYSKFFTVLIVLALSYLLLLGHVLGFWAPASSGVPPYGLEPLTAYRLVGWLSLGLVVLVGVALWRIIILGIRKVHNARR